MEVRGQPQPPVIITNEGVKDFAIATWLYPKYFVK
jgi:hypothetical protein